MQELNPPVILPDGTTFKTWEQATVWRRTLHVAAEHPRADDANDGSEQAPLRTIQAAAELLAPGERVLIHAGTYRERVRPPRGGDGPTTMIGYHAAGDGEVIITGAERYDGPWQRTTDWDLARLKVDAPVYHLPLPPEWFVGYLPFGMVNMPQHHLDMGWGSGFPDALRWKLQIKRGLIFQDGRRLRQVAALADLNDQDGTYWCESNGLDVHIRPFEDGDPAQSRWEFTVREQGFVPRRRNASYIHLRGLTVERCADGFPWPQHAAISAAGGTHWIIEDCTIRQVNADGIDLGRHYPSRSDHGNHGHHIVRRNRIEDCGISGISATAYPLHNMLIEDNTLVRCGWHSIERLWECAAIKQHWSKDCVYRRNVIADCIDASGIWLDFGITNSRVTQNLFINTRSAFGAVFIEAVKVGRVLVDHNIIVGSQEVEPLDAAMADGPVRGGNGIYEHDCDRLIVAHNLIVGCEATAIQMRLGQVNRLAVTGRGATCRNHLVANNLLVDCGRAIEFGRPFNRAQGNAYAQLRQKAPWRIHEPAECLDWDGWREFHGHDAQGSIVEARAEFDPDTLTLRLTLPPDLPRVDALELPLLDWNDTARPGAQVAPGPFADPGASWQGSVDPRREADR